MAVHAYEDKHTLTIMASVVSGSIVLKIPEATGPDTVVASGDTIIVDSNQSDIGTDAVRIELHESGAEYFKAREKGAFEDWIRDTTASPLSWSLRQLPASDTGTNTFTLEAKAYDAATNTQVGSAREQVIIIKRRPT